MSRTLLTIGACVLAGLVWILPAQETRATLSGTVTDQSGAVIAGAGLKLVNVETGVAMETVSNESGHYRFLFLNPGIYRLTVEHSGFRTFIRDNLSLNVGQSAVVNVPLVVGPSAESITVSSEAPLLEAERADRGLVVDNRTVVDMPLNIRNPIMLAALSPGIIHTSGTQHLNPFSNNGISSWSVNGGRGSNNEFLLDGAPNNTLYNRTNNIAYVPSVDAVEEFKVMSNSYDAQYGRTGGGVINVSIKSGTNQFHGSAYEFLKRTQLNANTFANNSKNAPRQGNALDQYGFTLGGPVWLPKVYRGKDRTFFFFAFEKYREDTYYPAESISSVPTELQRRGDFSRTFDNSNRLLQIYDPLSGRLEGSRWVRSPFAGNRIPADRINPVAANIVKQYPLPNTTTPGSVDWQNNFFLNPNTGRFNFINLTARVDHSFSPLWRMYGRWSWSDFTQLRLTTGIPGVAGDYRNGGKFANGGVIDSIVTLTPRTILNLRAALNRWEEALGPYANEGFTSARLGWPQALVSQFPRPDLFPRIDIDGARSLGMSSGNLTFEPTTTLSLQPNIVHIRSNHTFKAGLDFRVSRYTQVRPGPGGGQFSFNRAFTRSDYLVQDAVSGVGMASFLLGYPASGSVNYVAEPFWQWVYYSPWVQDDWKITRRLTINLGLRWDINLPATERYNQINRGFFADLVNPISEQIDKTRFPNFVVRGGIGFAGVNGLPRSPVDADRDNFQPRVGAAYSLNEKTVVRGGWGVFYLNPVIPGNLNGFSQSTPYVSSTDAGRTPASSLSDPFPTGVQRPPRSSLGLRTFLGQGPTYTNPDSKTPYVHQFSLAIQRQLPLSIMLEAAYVGSRSMQQITNKGVNEIPVEALNRGNPWLGGDPNYLNQAAPNPFAGLIPGTGLNNATVPRQQLLRPFPQFTGFNVEALNTGRIWYNSLQITAIKRYARGFFFTTTYTYSKNIEAIDYLNAQDSAPTRSLTDWDRTHRWVIAPSYSLPFGKGRRWLADAHAVAERIAGGWQLVVSTVLQSGDPMSIPGNVYLLRDPRVPNPTWDRLFNTGVIDVNGTVRNVLPGEAPAFAVRPPFSLRVTPTRYGNLRNQWANTVDASLIKNTRLREGWNLQLRVDAFNAFNTPVFSSDPNLDPTSPNFGKIFRDNGQSNFPRNVQLGLRLVF